MINSDWEGPWVTADHAFDIMRQGIKHGDKLFSAISAYDDYLAYIVKKNDYEPGNTLLLIAPFLIAFGLDDSFLVDRAKDNANFIKGSLKAIELLRDHYTVNIISTSYQQYVHYTTFLAGIPQENTYCTRFPIDEYANEISDVDKVLVREIADSILSMGPIEIKSEDEPEENTIECIRQMNHFFWELLTNSGFSRVMQELKPVGGVRKFEAVARALEKEGLELDRSATIGDSITDWNMLKKTREAGGLALSFNGNEYAVSNCNVAVMSENCMVTALLADVFERGGLEAVEALISDWGWSGIKALNRQEAVDESIYNAFRQAFSGSVFPHAVWVTQDNVEDTIEVSKRYRKSVRGTQIGVLG
jgi:energy-converting hydrogenase A subunit R